MARVYLSLGSNVSPVENLRLAMHELGRRFGALTVSPVYRNKAVGFDGDDFLNMVVGCDIDSDVENLVAEIEDIHELAGRVRGRQKFSSRSLDIDILTHDQQVLPGPPLKLPRADILRYAFVLKPLVDIDPDGIHPETGRTFADHWQNMQAAVGNSAGGVLHAVDIDLY